MALLKDVWKTDEKIEDGISAKQTRTHEPDVQNDDMTILSLLHELKELKTQQNRQNILLFVSVLTIIFVLILYMENLNKKIDKIFAYSSRSTFEIPARVHNLRY